MTSGNRPAIRDLETALAALDNGLGAASAVHLLSASDRSGVAIGRWRHDGASMALDGIRPTRLVLSLIGGQQLRWSRDDGSVTSTARCGSVAIVRHDPAARIDIMGRGDTLQILVVGAEHPGGRLSDRTLVAAARGSARLRSLAAQALVAMRAGQQDRLDGLLCAIALAMEAPAAVAPKRAEGHLTPALLAAIKGDIHTQLSVDPERLPSVRDLANRASLSPWHFIRMFDAIEGITPHAWIADQRREFALSQLLEKGSSVTDAAIASGHGSAAHFVATFRRAFGVTPGQLQAAVLDV